ncbi:hypothetical protein SAY86_018472 [Trapa natans]|nr:hypothetical protein SAY86_018472 [Trapa natans]
MKFMKICSCCFRKKTKQGEGQAKEAETLTRDKATKEITEEHGLAAAAGDSGVSSHGNDGSKAALD